MGCVALVNGMLNLALNAGGNSPGGPCSVAVVFLVGVVFLHVGWQTVQGKARDTLGNGVGSLIFALFNLAVIGLLVVGGFAAGGPQGMIVGIVGGISSVIGIALVVAGILALVGRAEYRAWRDAEKKRQDSDVTDTSPPPTDHNR